MTDSDDALLSDLLGLTPAQEIAAEKLATGSTHAEAAEAAGVKRETVTRWSGHHLGFRAALARARAAGGAERAARIRRIRDKSLTAVEEGLDAGTVDPLAVLKAIGSMTEPAEPVPTADELFDREANRTRVNLQPLPPARTTDQMLYEMENPPPSDAERARSLTIRRLADGAGLAAEEDG